MKGLFFSLGFVLLIFNNSNAQNKQKDSLKITNIDEVVVTAQYTAQAEKNAVYKVKVINTATIKAKAGQNLTDILRNELNMDFSFHPAFGTGIELNGVSKENIKILVDGVPLIGRVNGVLNLNQINMDNIARIEMIEGPVSVFYGTDAMGGIINLITNKKQTQALSGNISASYDTVDLKDIDANIGFKLGENIFKISGGHTYFNGTNTTDENNRSLNWPKKSQYYGQFKYLNQLGKYKLRFSSDFSEELVNTLGEIRFNKATDIDYTTRRFDNTLNIKRALDDTHFIDVTLSYLNYDRFDTSYKFVPATDTSTLIENNPNANANYFDTYFAKAQYAKSDTTSKLNYALGMEFEANHGEGNRILEGKQHISNTSIYTSFNYRFNEYFELQPAVRYTYNTVFNNLLSPAFNAKYRFNEQQALRFAYGNGFRAPSIKELYLDWSPTFGPFTYVFKGNENLKLESSHSFSLYYSLKSLNNGTISIEPAFSYNVIKDLIGLSELQAFERHYINLNKMKSINYSVQANFKASNYVKMNLGLSYLGRYIEYSDTFNSGKFMYTPNLTASIDYTNKPLQLNASIFYKYSGARDGHYIDNVGGTAILKETTRESFSNLDLSINKSFKKKINLGIGAKNIFDVTDIETVNQIGVAHERNNQLWGRSFYIKLNIKF